MVRVMFYTGIAVLSASFALLYLSTSFVYFIALALSLLLILLIIFKRKINFNGIKTLTAITLIFVLSGLFILEFKVKPAQNLKDCTATFQGTVCDWPTYNEDYTTYMIDAKSVDIFDENNNYIKTLKNTKIRVSDSNNSNFDVFQNVDLKIKFTDVDKYKASLYSKGVYASGYTLEKGLPKGYNKPFYAIFFDLRKYVNKLIFNNVNYNEASVASAVLMGDFEFLDEDFYRNSKITGVTHMLVVSGMHLGIIFQLLGAVMAFFKVPHRIKSLMLMLSIFAVSAICGFTPSILRAGLTYFIIALGMFLFKKPDPLNSLGVATVVICFVSPFSAGNIGLLLSLFSTFGIIYICPLIYEKCIASLNSKLFSNSFVKGIILAVCQTVSATVCTLPISVLVFGYFSLISILVNVLVGYSMTAVLVLTLTVVIMLWFPLKIYPVISLSISLLCFAIRYSVFVINTMAEIGNSVIATETVYLVPWILIIAGLILSVIKNSKSFKEKAAKILKNVAIAFLAFGIILTPVTALFSKSSKLSVMSFNTGYSVVLCYDDISVAIGSGDGKNDAKWLKDYILSLGKTKIDYIILPTLNKSYAGGAVALLKEFPNSRVSLPTDGEFISSLNYVSNDKFTYFKDRCVFPLKNGEEILIYKDKGVIINLNSQSFIIMLGGKIGDFKDYIKNKKVSLICSGFVPEDIIDYNFLNITLMGKGEAFADIKKLPLKYKNINNTFEDDLIYKINGV